MPEIANCPKCGATVTVERWSGDDEKVMGFHCPTCGFMYLAHGDLTDEQNIAAWNDQPVIQRLRAEVEELKEAMRWIPVTERKPVFSWGYVDVTIRKSFGVLPISGMVLWHDGIFDCTDAQFITHWRERSLPAQ